MRKNKSVYYTLLFFITYFNVYGQETITKVQVLQEENNIPIPYANISWKYITETNLKGNAVSDEDGYFSIKNESNREVSITISCIGFKAYTDTIRIEETHKIYLKEDIFNLEQVTVTGTRTPHSLKRAPVLTQVVSSKEIDQINATTVLEALESEIPGIETARHGYGPALNMQGLDASYTLVLIDGERAAGETDGNIDYSKINAGNIDRIEIIRGASSTLYGSNAIGGVINIITKKPKNNVDFKIDLRYDQQNEKNYSSADLDLVDDGDYRLYLQNHDFPTLNGNISLGIKKEKLYSHTYINFKSADAYQLTDSKAIEKYYPNFDTTIINNDNVGTPTSSINGYMDYTINQKIGYQNDHWKYELRANYYQHEEFDFDNNNIHNLFKNYTIGGHANYTINSNQNLNFALNHDTYNKFDAFDKTDDKSHNYRQSFNNARLNYTLNLKEKHNLLIGVENFNEELESDMFDSSGVLITKNANDFVWIIQDEYKLKDQFIMILGARNSWHSAYGYHITPSVSAKYSVRKINFRLYYARGFRSPSLKELYMNWDHLGMFEIIGNSDLKPEENNYYSFSAEYLHNNSNLNITLITSYNQIYNKIDGYWSGSNQDTYYYNNVGEQSIINIEGLLKWKIWKGIKLKGGYVYTKLTDISESVNLSAISPHSFTTQIEYSFQKENYRLSANISGKIRSKKEYMVQSDINDIYPEEYYQVKYPAYSIWNFTINQKYLSYSLNAGIKNLFNYIAPIANYNTSASPGRRYFISLGYNF